MVNQPPATDAKPGFGVSASRLITVDSMFDIPICLLVPVNPIKWIRHQKAWAKIGELRAFIHRKRLICPNANTSGYLARQFLEQLFESRLVNQAKRRELGMRNLISAVTVALALLASVASAAAQVATTGTIQIVATDADGGRLPGVSVTAKAVDTVTTRTAVTNDEGVATLEALAPSTVV